ncbi:MAG: DUF2024 family protein, partial [Mariprofundaceae bacterium]
MPEYNQQLRGHMKIHVFDTYVWAKNGTRLHFDVFLPEQDEAKALAAARAWL